MKTLLKNGLIYDGTGKEPFFGDILINGDRIEKVESEINQDGVEGIDLKGLSVSSGFFDAHSHNDWFAIKKDPIPYFEPFIKQGITSFITGNCGLSSTGFEQETVYKDKIGSGLFGFHETTGVYGSVKDFFEAIDQKNPCNIATLVGHCSARAGLTGYSNRALTKEESAKMLAILEKGLQEGACGLSFGLMYEPGIFAPTDELKEVAALCKAYDRPLTVHPRACSAVSMAYPQLLGRPHLLRALDELAEIVRSTKVKLQYSHAIFVGRKSFKCKDELVGILEKLNEEGFDVAFDIYSELLGVSVITVVMPAWYQALNATDKRKWFNKLRFSILAKASIALLGFDFNDIQIAFVGLGNEKYEGKTVAQIAKEEGKSQIDAYLDLCEMSNFQGRVNMGPYSTPEIVSSLSKHKKVLYMTDAWVEDHGIQNPAIYDCYPKFLFNSLNGTGDTMAMTVRKMTGAVSDRFAIKDRGYIKKGVYADITVFDEKTLVKEATADGIRRVFINGHQVLENGKFNEKALATSGYAMKV